MRKFREIWDDTINALQQCGKLDADNEHIHKGEVGKLPSSTPFVMVFARPLEPLLMGENILNGIHRMELTIFCGIGDGDDMNESLTKALEQCEICFNALPKYFDREGLTYRYDFDAHYGNYSVAYLTVQIKYETL